MINIKLLCEKNEIIKYINSLWMSDIFKEQSKNEKSFIYKLVKEVSQDPIIFYDMTTPKVEKSHFTAWFRCIAHREYENPYVNDLYYYHELFHTFTLLHNVAERIFSDEFNKTKFIVENEMFTSLESEVFIYFRIPELREKTFTFNIWYDHLILNHPFIKDNLEEYIKIFSGNDYYSSISSYSSLEFFERSLKHKEYELIKYICDAREKAMIDPDPNVFSELQIKEYKDHNNKWMDIWKYSAGRIDDFLYKLLNDVGFNAVYPELTKGAALLTFVMENMNLKHNRTRIPFFREAIDYSEIYHSKLVPNPV